MGVIVLSAVVHRSRRIQHLNNHGLRIRELEATSIRQEKTIEDLRERNDIAQLLITRYKEHENEEATLESKEATTIPSRDSRPMVIAQVVLL